MSRASRMDTHHSRFSIVKSSDDEQNSNDSLKDISVMTNRENKVIS